MSLTIRSGQKCKLCGSSFIFTMSSVLIVRCKCGSFSLEPLLFLAEKVRERGGVEIQSVLFRNCFGSAVLKKFEDFGFLSRREEKSKFAGKRVYFTPTLKFKKFSYNLLKAVKSLKVFLSKFKGLEI